MTYKGHVLLALSAGVPIAHFVYGSSLEAVWFLIALSIGALAPDLDEEGSYLSRKIPIFPMIFKVFGVTHRGITHRLVSTVFLMLMFFGMFTLEPELKNYLNVTIGFVLGYLMHLVGDMLTKGGIVLFFYPFSEAKGVLLPRNLRFYTNSADEFLVIIFLIGVVSLEIVFVCGVLDAKFF